MSGGGQGKGEGVDGFVGYLYQIWFMLVKRCMIEYIREKETVYTEIRGYL